MKIGFVFGLAVISPFVWVPVANAQSPTPEPPTATPVVTQIWPGPTRTPIGALGGCDPALTPVPEQYDLEYRFNCGHCFPKPTLSGSTSTPWPTVSFVTGTPGTAVPAGTETPQVTVTPTPAGQYEVEYLGRFSETVIGSETNTSAYAMPACDPDGYILVVHRRDPMQGAVYWSGWSAWHT
ncbi:MAG: hypothetical protein H8D34_28600, partial [Chloroflexi bacterium]|nr:hypothetical protein [Chloroflexota bacterium]